jgi:hypothetical protein
MIVAGRSLAAVVVCPRAQLAASRAIRSLLPGIAGAWGHYWQPIRAWCRLLAIGAGGMQTDCGWQVVGGSGSLPEGSVGG